MTNPQRGEGSAFDREVFSAELLRVSRPLDGHFVGVPR
jgi:hypothetical protein